MVNTRIIMDSGVHYDMTLTEEEFNRLIKNLNKKRLIFEDSNTKNVLVFRTDAIQVIEYKDS